MVKNFIVKHEQKIVKIFLATLFVLFGYIFFASLIKPLYQDEGVFLTIGRGITEGKLPYLDFWDHKTPGIYYLWAALFPLFGTKVIMYKVFIWLIAFITGGFVYGISEKLMRGSGKLSFVFFLCSVVFLEGNYLSAGPFLGLFLAAAVWLLIVYPKKRLATFGSGVALALAIIFKQTAILNILPLLIYLVVSWNLVNILLFIVGFSLPIWLVINHLTNNQSVGEFWSQAFGASTKSYPADPINKVLSSLKETFARIWWILVGALVSFLHIRKMNKEWWLVILMILVPAYSFFARPYPHYWLQVLPFVAVLSGSGFMMLMDWIIKQKFNYIIFLVFGMIIITYIYSISWFTWVTNEWNAPKEKEQTEIVSVIKDLPGNRILAENRYTGFNFLSGRTPVVKYLYLTEVNEGESARTKTIEALASGHELVAVWPKDQTYVYAKEIGDYLVQNFQKVGEYPALDLIIYYKD